ncbi:hypothetical protein AZI86_02750 [Bdellovibrio bacteriovorus]|uniref:Uncharacterized protein n=1 Tax=Bdellovibrio bacteriovorus TaxID=959 RepID=A0A150WP86_BDEBC|nr:tetratricopeptide repeat protein [Bdellovibrio bacteriovorus]KYG66005.1 hypothetical protein AZI86_02750 [Bdellovibrio bacteriovorus]
MMDEAVNSDKNWLVKSSTRILGPFTAEELAQQLKTKQISIIDEIRQPHGRWSYIRENHGFMEVIRAIREEQDANGENTMTHSIAQHTSTKTDALVEFREDTVTPPPDSDLTPIPDRMRSAVPGLKDVTPVAERPINRANSATAPAKVYGSSQDSGMQARMRQQSEKMRWAMIAVTVIAALAVVFLVTRKEQKKGGSFSELISQAIRYKNLGLYEKSLASYQRAVKLQEPDADTVVQMAPVLISEDRQTLMGRRVLESALGKEGRSRSETMDALLGIAVSYMMDGDLKQAEDTLQKAIGNEPFNAAALINMAIIQLKKGNYQQAMRDFDSIHRKNPQSVFALFGRAIATMEYSRRMNDLNPLPLLVRDIRASVAKTAYLRQELLLFQIAAQSLLGDVDGVNQGVVQFLNQLSGQAKNYVHPLTMDWRFTQWDYLEKFCADIFQKYSTNPEVKALRSVCLMEINRDSDAAKILLEAMSEAPKDPYVLVTQAGYLVKIGRVPEAKSILKMPELSTLNMRNLLLGQICIESQDVTCAQNAYAAVYANDRANATASYGLAWVKMRSNDRAAAYEYVRAGLQSESNYLPLLDLRDQLEYER